ncbi:SNF1-interacting protein [Apophysomyces sp. BC1021]|nr:SNF1-interacting protein [Apophysomyces sp. BC1021]
MGANGSKDNGRAAAHSVHHTHQKIEDLVDLGSVLPSGLYPTTEQDYDPRCVRNLIIARKLAPFYKGLPDVPDPVPPTPQTSVSSSMARPVQSRAAVGRPRSVSSSKTEAEKAADSQKERQKTYVEKMKQREKMLYNDAVECPICFLFRSQDPQPKIEPSSGARHTTSGVSDGTRLRRKSVSYKNPKVVLVDHVRPDWNKSLTLPKSARSASRRNSASAGQSSSRSFLRTTAVGPLFTRAGRSASSAASTEYNHFLSTIRDMNMDLEEWMVMEAVRLSLAEQEERERQEAQSNPQQELHDTTALAGNNDNDDDEDEDDDDDDDEPLANVARMQERAHTEHQQGASSQAFDRKPPSIDKDDSDQTSTDIVC